MNATPTRRMADLVIGSKPTRSFELRQDNAAVNITGFTFKAELLTRGGAAAPLLSILAADVLILDAAAGRFAVKFPTLTATNTGDRDENRIFRFLIWAAGDNIAGPPREIIQRQVTIL